MSTKYAPLMSYLSAFSGQTLSMTFEEIEAILAFALPKSARTHAPWWSNSPYRGRHNSAWLEAGWSVIEPRFTEGKVSFQRRQAGNTFEPKTRNLSPRKPIDESGLDLSAFAPDCSVQLTLQWKAVGKVDIDDEGKLRFPSIAPGPGLYRLNVDRGHSRDIYVGEAADLRRRFGNYRRPAATQQTSLRINLLLLDAMGYGAVVTVDIARHPISLSVNGMARIADLHDKATRRMLEHAAIVAHGGIEINVLNR